ncbi:MAG: hypothetical protein GF417_05390 [Candidatus Latescibacteria bacterium]|nr:hypothetical protein [bacterium]MBD3423849.1 hypothetical protein [Candidatus Latescibacterota bacterium]
MIRKAFYTMLAIFILSSQFSIAIEQTTFGLAMVLWLALIIMGGKEKPRRTVLDFPLAALVIATILSSLLSGDPAGSLRATRNYLLIPVIYLTGFSIMGRKRAGRTAMLFLGAAAASAITGIILFLMGSGDGGLKRASGTFSMPLTYGGIMMLACSLFLALTLSREGSDRRGIILLGGGTLLTAAALFLSFTRSSWLGMLISGLIAMVILKRKLIVPFILLLVLFTLILPGEYRSRITSIWDPDYPSNRQRIELIRGGWRIFRENVILGVGPGDLAREYEQHMPRGAEVIHGHMHNTFLHIAVTRGILGLLAFLWLILAVYRLLFETLRLDLPPPEKGWVAGSLGAFTGFLVNGLFEWNFGDAEVITVLYIIIGSNLLLRMTGQAREKGA